MDAMSNHEIGSALSKYNSFLGVFSANINPIPLIRSYPCCFIMNTKPRSEANGGHWLAFYLLSSNCLEFFDSLGLSLASYITIHHYFVNFNIIHSNKFQLQLPSTSLCGDYCVTFITLRVATNSYPSSIEIIKSNSKGKVRDSFVRRVRLFNK